MLTDAQRSLYYQAQGLSPAVIREIEEMRTNSPSRLVNQRGLKNTLVDFYSPKGMERRKLESYTVEFLYGLELEVFGDCHEYYVQVSPKNIVRDGRTSSASVDFMVLEPEGVHLVECKPTERLEKLAERQPGEWTHKDGVWTRPYLHQWARERGLRYSIWTPPRCHGIYQANLLTLSAQLSPSSLQPAHYERRIRQLVNELRARPLTLSCALDLVPGLSGGHVVVGLARGQIFGTLQSTAITDIERFTLYATRDQAATCDAIVLNPGQTRAIRLPQQPPRSNRNSLIYRAIYTVRNSSSKTRRAAASERSLRAPMGQLS